MEQTSNKGKDIYYLFLFSILLALNFTTFEHNFILAPDTYYFVLKGKIFKYLIRFIFLTLIFFLMLKFIFNFNISNKNYKILFLLLILILITLIFFRYKNYYYNLIIFIFIFLIIGIFIINEKDNIVFEKNHKILFFLLIVLTLVIIFMGFKRAKSYHDSFHTNACDLGIFMNTLYILSNNYSGYTLIEGLGTGSRFGIHFDWFLYLLSVIYELNNEPILFIFLQIFFVFLGASILYLISNFLLNNNLFSYLISLSYVISPLTIASVDFDFHLDPFYPFFIFSFIYFNLTKKHLLSVCFFILSLSLKEEISIYLFFICLFLYLNKKEKFNIYLAFVSLLYGIVVIKMIMPVINSYGTHADSLMYGIINNFWNQIFDKQKLINFIFYLGGHTLFLAFLDLFIFLFLFLPPAAIHYFHPKMYDIQYAALVLPAVFLSIIFFIYKKKHLFDDKRLENFGILIFFVTIGLNFFKTPNFNLYENIFLLFMLFFLSFLLRKKLQFIFVLFLCIICIYVFNRGYYRYNKYRSDIDNTRKEILKEILKEIVKEIVNEIKKEQNMAVVANLNIVPHISNRRYIVSFEPIFIDIMRRIVFNKINKFKIIYDGNRDILQSDNDFKIVKVNFEQLRILSKKMGYKEKLLFNKNNVFILYFEK